MADIPSLYKASFNGRCKKGFYKIFLAVANKSYNTDYHFYRQDKNKYWSHKPGRTEVSNLDASNELITNPEKANRNYNSYNYSTSCGFFCLNTKLSRAISNP